MQRLLRPATNLEKNVAAGSKKRGLDVCGDTADISPKRMTVRGGEANAVPAQADEIKTPVSGSTASSNPDSIDESLYSRQLYVLGHEAMRRMQRSSILLVGLGGLGVEVAKNLALAGVKSLTLHDPRPVELSDLSSQFYCTEADVGKNRAVVSRDRLADLNQYVRIDVLEGPVSASELANFSLVLCTDACFGECVAVNDACRELGIAFIMAQVNHGLQTRISSHSSTDTYACTHALTYTHRRTHPYETDNSPPPSRAALPGPDSALPRARSHRCHRFPLGSGGGGGGGGGGTCCGWGGAARLS